MLSRRYAAAFLVYLAALLATAYILPQGIALAADLKCSTEKAYDTQCNKDQIGRDGKPTGKKGGLQCPCQETDEKSGKTVKGKCNAQVLCIGDKDAEGRDAAQPDCNGPNKGSAGCSGGSGGAPGAPGTEPPPGSPEAEPGNDPVPEDAFTKPLPNETPQPDNPSPNEFGNINNFEKMLQENGSLPEWAQLNPSDAFSQGDIGNNWGSDSLLPESQTNPGMMSDGQSLYEQAFGLDGQPGFTSGENSMGSVADSESFGDSFVDNAKDFAADALESAYETWGDVSESLNKMYDSVSDSVAEAYQNWIGEPGTSQTSMGEGGDPGSGGTPNGSQLGDSISNDLNPDTAGNSNGGTDGSNPGGNNSNNGPNGSEGSDGSRPNDSTNNTPNNNDPNSNGGTDGSNPGGNNNSNSNDPNSNGGTDGSNPGGSNSNTPGDPNSAGDPNSSGDSQSQSQGDAQGQDQAKSDSQSQSTPKENITGIEKPDVIDAAKFDTDAPVMADTPSKSLGDAQPTRSINSQTNSQRDSSSDSSGDSGSDANSDSSTSADADSSAEGEKSWAARAAESVTNAASAAADKVASAAQSAAEAVSSAAQSAAQAVGNAASAVGNAATSAWESLTGSGANEAGSIADSGADSSSGGVGAGESISDTGGGAATGESAPGSDSSGPAGGAAPSGGDGGQGATNPEVGTGQLSRDTLESFSADTVPQTAVPTEAELRAEAEANNRVPTEAELRAEAARGEIPESFRAKEEALALKAGALEQANLQKEIAASEAQLRAQYAERARADVEQAAKEAGATLKDNVYEIPKTATAAQAQALRDAIDASNYTGAEAKSAYDAYKEAAAANQQAASEYFGAKVDVVNAPASEQVYQALEDQKLAAIVEQRMAEYAGDPQRAQAAADTVNRLNAAQDYFVNGKAPEQVADALATEPAQRTPEQKASLDQYNKWAAAKSELDATNEQIANVERRLTELRAQGNSPTQVATLQQSLQALENNAADAQGRMERADGHINDYASGNSSADAQRLAANLDGKGGVVHDISQKISDSLHQAASDAWARSQYGSGIGTWAAASLAAGIYDSAANLASNIPGLEGLQTDAHLSASMTQSPLANAAQTAVDAINVATLPNPLSNRAFMAAGEGLAAIRGAEGALTGERALLRAGNDNVGSAAMQRDIATFEANSSSVGERLAAANDNFVPLRAGNDNFAPTSSDGPAGGGNSVSAGEAVGAGRVGESAAGSGAAQASAGESGRPLISTTGVLENSNGYGRLATQTDSAVTGRAANEATVFDSPMYNANRYSAPSGAANENALASAADNGYRPAAVPSSVWAPEYVTTDPYAGLAANDTAPMPGDAESQTLPSLASDPASESRTLPHLATDPVGESRTLPHLATDPVAPAVKLANEPLAQAEPQIQPAPNTVPSYPPLIYGDAQQRWDEAWAALSHISDPWDRVRLMPRVETAAFGEDEIRAQQLGIPYVPRIVPALPYGPDDIRWQQYGTNLSGPTPLETTAPEFANEPMPTATPGVDPTPSKPITPSEYIRQTYGDAAGRAAEVAQSNGSSPFDWANYLGAGGGAGGAPSGSSGAAPSAPQLPSEPRVPDPLAFNPTPAKPTLGEQVVSALKEAGFLPGAIVQTHPAQYPKNVVDLETGTTYQQLSDGRYLAQNLDGTAETLSNIQMADVLTSGAYPPGLEVDGAYVQTPDPVSGIEMPQPDTALTVAAAQPVPNPSATRANPAVSIALGAFISAMTPIGLQPIADLVGGPIGDTISSAAQAAEPKISERDAKRLKDTEEAFGRVESGRASWWDTGSNGGLNPSDRNASGSMHNRSDFTVAMLGGGPKYAWGTKLLVKNVSRDKDGNPGPNFGKVVEVTVASTGGQPDRALDLSPKAMDALGGRVAGVIDVEFVVVYVPNEQQATYKLNRTDLKGAGAQAPSTFDTRVAQIRSNPTSAIAQAPSMTPSATVNNPLPAIGQAINDAAVRGFKALAGNNSENKALAIVNASKGSSQVDIAAKLKNAGLQNTDIYKAMQENAAHELAGKPNGQGDVTKSQEALADSRINQRANELKNPVQAAPTLEQAAKQSGRPQIPGIDKMVYLTPLGDPAKANPRKFIVIHQTEGPSAAGAARAQAARPSKTGTTLWVEPDGTVYWATPENTNPSHVRGNRNDNKFMPNQKTYNQISNANAIGIEFAGNFPDVAKPLTREQMEAGIALIKFLQVRYNIPSQNVLAHGWTDYKDTRYVEGDQLAKEAQRIAYVPGQGSPTVAATQPAMSPPATVAAPPAVNPAPAAPQTLPTTDLPSLISMNTDYKPVVNAQWPEGSKSVPQTYPAADAMEGMGQPQTNITPPAFDAAPFSPLPEQKPTPLAANPTPSVERGPNLVAPPSQPAVKINNVPQAVASFAPTPNPLPNPTITLTMNVPQSSTNLPATSPFPGLTPEKIIAASTPQTPAVEPLPNEQTPPDTKPGNIARSITEPAAPQANPLPAEQTPPNTKPGNPAPAVAELPVEQTPPNTMPGKPARSLVELPVEQTPPDTIPLSEIPGLPPRPPANTKFEIAQPLFLKGQIYQCMGCVNFMPPKIIEKLNAVRFTTKSTTFTQGELDSIPWAKLDSFAYQFVKGNFEQSGYRVRVKSRNLEAGAQIFQAGVANKIARTIAHLDDADDTDEAVLPAPEMIEPPTAQPDEPAIASNDTPATNPTDAVAKALGNLAPPASAANPEGEVASAPELPAKPTAAELGKQLEDMNKSIAEAAAARGELNKALNVNIVKGFARESLDSEIKAAAEEQKIMNAGIRTGKSIKASPTQAQKDVLNSGANAADALAKIAQGQGDPQLRKELNTYAVDLRTFNNKTYKTAQEQQSAFDDRNDAVKDGTDLSKDVTSMIAGMNKKLAAYGKPSDIAAQNKRMASDLTRVDEALSSRNDAAKRLQSELAAAREDEADAKLAAASADTIQAQAKLALPPKFDPTIDAPSLTPPATVAAPPTQNVTVATGKNPNDQSNIQKAIGRTLDAIRRGDVSGVTDTAIKSYKKIASAVGLGPKEAAAVPQVKTAPFDAKPIEGSTISYVCSSGGACTEQQSQAVLVGAESGRGYARVVAGDKPVAKADARKVLENDGVKRLADAAAGFITTGKDGKAVSEGITFVDGKLIGSKTVDPNKSQALVLSNGKGVATIVHNGEIPFGELAKLGVDIGQNAPTDILDATKDFAKFETIMRENKLSAFSNLLLIKNGAIQNVKSSIAEPRRLLIMMPDGQLAILNSTKDQTMLGITQIAKALGATFAANLDTGSNNQGEVVVQSGEAPYLGNVTRNDALTSIYLGVRDAADATPPKVATKDVPAEQPQPSKPDTPDTAETAPAPKSPTPPAPTFPVPPLVPFGVRKPSADTKPPAKVNEPATGASGDDAPPNTVTPVVAQTPPPRPQETSITNTKAPFADTIHDLAQPPLQLTLREAWKIDLENGTSYAYDAFDTMGKNRMRVEVSIVGTEAKIENILETSGGDALLMATAKPNIIGTSQMRALLKQFQILHPEVQTLVAERVSGARFGGTYIGVYRQGSQISIKLPGTKNSLQGTDTNAGTLALPPTAKETVMTSWVSRARAEARNLRNLFTPGAFIGQPETAPPAPPKETETNTATPPALPTEASPPQQAAPSAPPALTKDDVRASHNSTEPGEVFAYPVNGARAPNEIQIVPTAPSDGVVVRIKNPTQDVTVRIPASEVSPTEASRNPADDTFRGIVSKEDFAKLQAMKNTGQMPQEIAFYPIASNPTVVTSQPSIAQKIGNWFKSLTGSTGGGASGGGTGGNGGNTISIKKLGTWLGGIFATGGLLSLSGDNATQPETGGSMTAPKGVDDPLPGSLPVPGRPDGTMYPTKPGKDIFPTPPKTDPPPSDPMKKDPPPNDPTKKDPPKTDPTKTDPTKTDPTKPPQTPPQTPPTPGPSPSPSPSPTGGGSGGNSGGLMSFLSGLLKGLSGMFMSQPQQPAPMPNQPTGLGSSIAVTMHASPTPIIKGQNVSVWWVSVNATACRAFNASSTQVALGAPDSSFITQVNATTSFSVYCTNTAGQYATGSVQIRLK